MHIHHVEQTLARLRYLAMYDDSPLARLFRDMDEHLSAGGTPPEVWREGPDAPTGHKDAIIRAADILGMDPADLTARLMDDEAPDLGPVGPAGECWGWQGSDSTPPPPEGLSVFAHWSRVHDGINVEMDVPDGLRLTVMVNEWQAVNTMIGQDDDR